ncbi:hypothetical protein Tco_1066186 [Tanacetum coccineum]
MVDGTGYLSLKGVHCSKFSCHRLVIVDIAKEVDEKSLFWPKGLRDANLIISKLVTVSLALLVRTYTVISYKVLQRRFTVGGRLKSKTTEDIISIEASWKFLFLINMKSPPLLALVQDSIHQQPIGPTHAPREGAEEKLKAVKARLNFEEVSQHSESGTPSKKRDLKKRLGSRRVRSMSRIPEPRRGRFESPRKKDLERKMVFKRLEKGVFYRLGDKGKSMSAYSNDSRRRSYHSSRGETQSCYQSSRLRET